MIKISIIIPLYNCEKYLAECLSSIQKQTFTDFEIICINDASKDSTLDILQNFQKRDDRIRVYSNEERMGAAISRNRGMRMANGEYLAFLDGDDIFDEEMLDLAYHTIERHKADVVMYDFMHVPSDSINNKLEKPHNQGYIDRYCRNTFTIREGEPYEFCRWTSGPWNKLYRRRFIEDNKIIFQDLPSCNDICFVCLALTLADRLIVVDDRRVMTYIRDHFEPTRISNNKDPMCAYNAYMKLGTELLKRNKFDDVFQHYYMRVLSGLFVALGKAKKEEEKKNFYNFLKNEGIRQLRSLSVSCYSQLNPYIRCKLEEFQKKDYESKWYLEEGNFWLESLLSYHATDITALFQTCTGENISVAIWGAGKNGEIFLKFCIEKHLHITAIIDKSAEKQGKVICGYEIVPPAKIWDEVQLIIVSAYGISDEVIKEVGERKIKVIDLNSFLKLV